MPREIPSQTSGEPPARRSDGFLGRASDPLSSGELPAFEEERAPRGSRVRDALGKIGGKLGRSRREGDPATEWPELPPHDGIYDTRSPDVSPPDTGLRDDSGDNGPPRTGYSLLRSDSPASSLYDTLGGRRYEDLDEESSVWPDMSEEPRGLLERIRGRKGRVAAVLAAVALAASVAGYAAKGKIFGSDSRPAAATWVSPDKSKFERTIVDLDGDRIITADEAAIQQEVPALADLPPLLDEPFHPEEETPLSFDQLFLTQPEDEKASLLLSQYEPKFLAAYETTQGLKFNIHAATQPGQEQALEQDLVVNPQGLEYMVQQIEKYIHDAPDNPAKHAIIQNFADLKTKDDRIVELVVDVSPEAGCLDAQRQMIAFVQKLCKYAGVTAMYPDVKDGSIDIPMAISSGAQYVMEKTIAKPDEHGVISSDEVKYRQKLVAHSAAQQRITAHELVHAMSVGGLSDNANGEGDHDHEVIEHIFNEEKGPEASYDFHGATAKSPELGDRIINLVEKGVLPPIVAVRKTQGQSK